MALRVALLCLGFPAFLLGICSAAQRIMHVMGGCHSLLTMQHTNVVVCICVLSPSPPHKYAQVKGLLIWDITPNGRDWLGAIILDTVSWIYLA